MNNIISNIELYIVAFTQAQVVIEYNTLPNFKEIYEATANMFITVKKGCPRGGLIDAEPFLNRIRGQIETYLAGQRYVSIDEMIVNAIRGAEIKCKYK